MTLLHLLVKYGYYDNLDDINKLMSPLLSLLNGTTDKPFLGATDEESKDFRQVLLKINLLFLVSVNYSVIVLKTQKKTSQYLN